jgi:flagellar hook-associated protein 3 FlgL
VSIIQLYARNASIANGISETTGSALAQMYDDVYVNATDFANKAKDDTVTAVQRSAFAADVNQLILKATQLGNTNFNQQYLFNGSSIGAAPFRIQGNSGHPTAIWGPDTDDSGNPVDPSDPLSIKMSESLELSPYSSGENNKKISEFIQRLVGLRDALEANDTQAIRTADVNLKKSEADLANMIAENGARSSRLGSLRDSLELRFSNISDETNRETSVDLATAMVNLTKTQTAYQAAMQAGAQILRLSLLDYIR